VLGRRRGEKRRGLKLKRHGKKESGRGLIWIAIRQARSMDTAPAFGLRACLCGEVLSTPLGLVLVQPTGWLCGGGK